MTWLANGSRAECRSCSCRSWCKLLWRKGKEWRRMRRRRWEQVEAGRPLGQQMIHSGGFKCGQLSVASCQLPVASCKLHSWQVTAPKRQSIMRPSGGRECEAGGAGAGARRNGTGTGTCSDNCCSAIVTFVVVAVLCRVAYQC